MKNKFPVLLLIAFIGFTIFKLGFSEVSQEFSRKNYIAFEKTIGELKYSLTDRELSSLKLKYSDILKTIDRLNVKKASETDQSNQESVNIYDDSQLKSKVLDYNQTLNNYTQRHLIEKAITKEDKPDVEKEKTVEDAYLETYETPMTIVFDDKKKIIQDVQMEELEKVLSPEDFDNLSYIITEMNVNMTYINAQVHQSILEILLKYPDIDAYLILGQLTGRFEILAYYELENGTITKKTLKAIKTQDINSAQDKRFKNLINMQTILLDVVHTKYFKGFFIFSDGEKGLLAYASDFQNNRRGYLGIDEKDFTAEISNDFEKTRFYHSVVNELSRVILLGNSQIDYTKGHAVSDIDDFETIKSLSKKDSYLSQFYTRFWDDLMYQDAKMATSDITKEKAKTYFYLRHKNEFLSEYVSQDPFKDIIESMTRFILEEKSLDNFSKSDKIRFFYEFAEISDIKQRIQLNIKNLED